MMKNKTVKYLGIDWGEARIGLALADSESKTAVPFNTVNSLEEVLGVVKSEEINQIVIGEPIKMAGPAAGVASAYLEFFAELKDRSGLPISQIDERLSSREADSLPGDKKTKAERDAVAAMLILQSYLDRIY